MVKLRQLPALVIACVLLVAPALASAGTRVVYSDDSRSIFEIAVPDFWTLRVGGAREISPSGEGAFRSIERVFGLEPESGHGVWLGLISPPRFASLEDAKAYARGLGSQLAKTTKILSSTDRRVAGFPATVVTGTGRRDGRPVSFNVSLIDLRNGRVVVALTIMEQRFDSGALDDVNAILNSIKAR